MERCAVTVELRAAVVRSVATAGRRGAVGGLVEPAPVGVEELQVDGADAEAGGHDDLGVVAPGECAAGAAGGTGSRHERNRTPPRQRLAFRLVPVNPKSPWRTGGQEISNREMDQRIRALV